MEFCAQTKQMPALILLPAVDIWRALVPDPFIEKTDLSGKFVNVRCFAVGIFFLGIRVMHCGPHARTNQPKRDWF